MSFSPLISLAGNAKRQKMEMQCDPQWVLDLAAERDQLCADLQAVIGQRDHYANRVLYLESGVLRIADDFQPPSAADAPQALGEMREALVSLVGAAMAAKEVV